MINLKEISRITGFSISTVSKALNDRFDINKDTKKCIKNIAFQHGYLPNKNAIALRKSKSNIIAVILPQVNIPLYSNTLFEIQLAASKKGYRILLYQSFEKESKEKEFFNDVCDGSVDGALVLTTNNKFSTESDTPMEHLQILENQSSNDILERCKVNFENLLKRIN